MGQVRALGQPHHSGQSWEPGPVTGQPGLIKVWAFRGVLPGRPALPPACPPVLAPAGHSPSPLQWPSQINLFWVWGSGTAAHLLGPPKPVSFSQHPPMQGPLWGLPFPEDLLEEERRLAGRDPGLPQALLSQVTWP